MIRLIMMDWLLIDGMNLAYRSFYAIAALKRSDGFPTNALHGWVRALWKLVDTYHPAGVAVFFDLEGGSQRHLDLLPEYKAQRAQTPQELLEQLPYIKQMTRSMGYPLVERPGIEADDLLASAAVALSKKSSVGIVSADKDFAQLVSDRISIIVPASAATPGVAWSALDAKGVLEKFGVSPSQIPDYLALIGDNVDNIPGIPGVGPKTAVKWIQQYGSVAEILAHTKEIQPARFEEKLKEFAPAIARNLELVRLRTDYPVDGLGEAAPDPSALIALMQSMEMHKTATTAAQRMGLPTASGQQLELL